MIEISKKDKQTVNIASKKLAVQLTLAESSSAELAVGPNLPNDLSKPGEYEYNDVSIFVAEQAEKLTGKGNVFKVVIDNVNLCLVTADVKLEKNVLDFLGDIDILIVQSSTAKQVIRDWMRDLYPRYILPLDEVATASFAEIIETSAEEAQKSFKAKSEDFKTEDYATTGVVIV